MRMTQRLHHAAAVVAVTAGTGLLAAALGGVAAVDSELQAVASESRIVETRAGTHRATYRPLEAQWPDCPGDNVAAPEV